MVVVVIDARDTTDTSPDFDSPRGPDVFSRD
jgi:hypothetical protein